MQLLQSSTICTCIKNKIKTINIKFQVNYNLFLFAKNDINTIK